MKATFTPTFGIRFVISGIWSILRTVRIGVSQMVGPDPIAQGKRPILPDVTGLHTIDTRDNVYPDNSENTFNGA